MLRRDFITLLGGATATWPFMVRAQTNAIRRLAVLFSLAEVDTEGQARLTAFREALEALGWIDGRNMRMDVRWGAADPQRMEKLATELVASRPDLIFAAPVSAALVVTRHTHAIPIVFAQTPDPVSLGLVKSLSRPGENVTGFALYETTIALKWLELLKQIAPSVARVAVLTYPELPALGGYAPKIQEGGPSLGLQVVPYPVRNGSDIEGALDAFAREPNGGLIVPPGAIAVTHRELIISLATRYRLPNVAAFRYYVASGGLASYGVDDVDQYRRAATYVDRILKGEKPGDLPVQFPTKYELAINLKTAKALGLDPPISLLARTDEVIE